MIDYFYPQVTKSSKKLPAAAGLSKNAPAKKVDSDSTSDSSSDEDDVSIVSDFCLCSMSIFICLWTPFCCIVFLLPEYENTSR